MNSKSLTNDHLLKQIDVLKEKINSLEKKAALQSQIEEFFKTSEKNLSVILEKNVDGIIIVDIYGTVLYVNPAAEKLFGKSEEDFIGYPFGFPVSTDESTNSLVIRKGNTYCEVEIRVVQVKWYNSSALQLSIRDITERKKAEDVLKKSEENFRSIFETAPNLILILNNEKIITICNDKIKQYLGYNYDEVLGKEINNFIPPENLAEVSNFFNEINNKGFVNNKEFRMIRKDNSVIDVYVNSSIYKTDYEKGTYTICIIDDITEKKRSINSIEYLASFPELNPNPVIEIDMDYNINYINPITEKLFPDIKSLGIKHQWLTAIESIIEIIKNDKDNVIYRDVPVGEKWYQQAIDYVKKNNSIRFYGIDITERKRSEEALKNSEEKFRSIMENSADAIFIADQNGKYVYTNKAVTDMLGFTPEEMKSKTILDMAPMSKINDYMELFSNILAAGKDFAEIELLKKDGSYILTDLNSVILPDGLVYGSCRDITERKKSETLLQEKEYVLSQSQRLGHIGSWGWDLIGPIKWTDEAYHIYGVTPETFTPTIESLISLIHPEDRQVMQQWMASCIAGESPEALEFRTILPDGSIHFIKGFGDLIYDSEGKPTFMGGTIQDITEQKKIEISLKESEIRYRRLFEAAKDGIIILDAVTGMIVDVNPFLIKLLGYSHEAFLGKTIWDIGFFKNIIANKTNFQKLQQEKYIRYEDIPLETIDGKTIDVEFVSNVYLVGEREVIQCNIRDITERKKTEKEVSFKNIILTTQQEASLDGILAIDEKGKIISYNKRYIEIWGIPAEKLENRYDGLTSEIILNKVISADDFLKKVNYLYEHPTETSFDELNLFDGTILERYSAPMIGYDGKYYGRIWSFRDISERKMSERMLIESEKMTEIAHLSAGVAHEFNNILAIIKSTSQLLLLEESLGKIRLDKRIIEELSIIDKQTIKGAEIVSNLMLFSKPDKTEKEYISIEDIIDDVLKLQKKQFEMENIEIIKKFNNKEKLLLNSGQIQQVFLNLSINALHAIKPKGKGKIEIVTENDTKNVVVTFSDNGIGMNDEIKNNIFKPFFTTKGANANDDLGLKGTGLGLAVSSSIIKEYNGSISVESIENKVTEFKITFPLGKKGHEENLKNKEKEVRLDNLYNKKINILIVDDEINIADNIAKILAAYGFENIDVNYSSSHVLNKLKNQNYDLFFIDIMMPEMKGDVLIERIISDKKFDKSNIVIMSGSYSDQIKKIISLYEKCLFLKKPFSSDDILKILDNIFGGIK